MKLAQFLAPWRFVELEAEICECCGNIILVLRQGNVTHAAWSENHGCNPRLRPRNELALPAPLFLTEGFSLS